MELRCRIINAILDTDGVFKTVFPGKDEKIIMDRVIAEIRADRGIVIPLGLVREERIGLQAVLMSIYVEMPADSESAKKYGNC